jgi:nanoRNase/pAp phosphatase (c-di-AMP/oligoRNAs hydrolase)
LEYRKELTKKWAAKGIKKKVTLLDGTSFEVMVANVQADFSSDVCAAMYEKNPTILAMTYVIGEKVYVSLRSKQGVGPSAKNVAEVFGGGGHENAAGFSLNTVEDFFNIFH